MDSSGIKNEPDTGIQLMADPQMPNPLLQRIYCLFMCISNGK